MSGPRAARLEVVPFRRLVLKTALLWRALIPHNSRRWGRDRSVQLVHRPERRERLVELARVADHEHRHLVAMHIFWRVPRHIFFGYLLNLFLILLQKIELIAIELVSHFLLQDFAGRVKAKDEGI